MKNQNHKQRQVTPSLLPTTRLQESDQTEQKLTNVFTTTTTTTTTTAAAAAAALKPGDKFGYKNAILMKLSGNFITDDEIQFIKDNWSKEVKNFIAYELKMNDFYFQKYLEAERESFQLYDLLIEPINREVKEKFGNQFQLILGEDLYSLRESSRVSYQKRLQTIFDSDRMARFEEFRNDYDTWVYQKFNVSWSDLR